MKKPEKFDKKKIWALLKKSINYLMGMFSNDIGMDLGTSSTLVYVKGRGIVLCEPSALYLFSLHLH